MRKIVLLTIVFLMATLCAKSQAIQNGYVEEYNGAKEKTPLSGVTIFAGGATAKSGKDGRFKLAFNTLNVGDRVNANLDNVAYLKGYIVFNKEAVEQWTVSGKNVYFRIVLCKKKKYEALVKRYYDVGDSSYKVQLKREQEKVQELLREGEIQQQEYERLLSEADERYQRAFRALRENAELVARIDESELDEEQEHILQLAKEGRIDEAAKLIRESDIIDRFDQAYDKNQYAGEQKEYYQQKVEESQEEQRKLLATLQEDEHLALEALATDSTNVSAKTHLVMSYLFQGRYDEAETIAVEIKEIVINGKTVGQIIVEQLKEFENKGVIPAERKEDIEKMRHLLQ